MKHSDLRNALHYAFWRHFLARAEARGGLAAGLPPVHGGYRDVHVGWTGVKYVQQVADHRLTVGLFIERPDRDWNLALFERLRADQAAIEAEFGGPLEWRSDRMKTCTVKFTVSRGGLLDVERWDELADRAIDGLAHLDAALRPRLGALGLDRAA